MQSEIKKITRIINEMTYVLMKKGSIDLEVKVKKNKDLSTIYIVDYNTKYSDEDICELNEVLNIQRQCEVEGYYWELVGEDNDGDELFIVGSMIDNAEVKKIGDNLYIKMDRSFRHKRCFN